MTFVALSPQHPLVARITDAALRETISRYQATANRLRVEEDRTMTGVFTGAYALHPLTSGLIPIWVADFVLEGHGAGAVMGVPAHDETDMAFALAMGMPFRAVEKPASSERIMSNQDT